MSITLEKINKNLLLVALALLIFRNGSFSSTFTIKPFEIVFTITVLLTLLDLIKNKKIKTFFNAIPRKALIAVTVLLFFILLGWAIAVFILHIPTPFNMVLEFGNFIICLGTFFLVLFYSRGDDSYAKKCLYALLVPAIYGIFVIFPNLAEHFHLAKNGTFNGFTDNVNIMSKTLLIPALYAITMTFFTWGDKRKKFLFAVLAILMTTLVFWTAERGAIGSLAIGMVITFAIFIWSNPSVKKILMNGLIALGIVILSFLMLPYSGKKVFVDRMIHSDAYQVGYPVLQPKTLTAIISGNVTPQNVAVTTSESRTIIWSYYLKQMSEHLFGIGPNTHINAQIAYNKVVFVNPGPHNTYLELLLWGGIGALLSFLYLIWNAYKNMFSKRTLSNSVTVSLIAIFTSLLVSIFFNDSIILVWIWVIMALMLREWNFQ